LQPGHRHVRLPPLPPRVAGGTPMHPGCSVHGSQGTPLCGSRPPRRAAAVHDGSHPQPLPTGAYTVSHIEYMRMCMCLHTQHAMCTCACASSWRWVDWRRQPTLPQCKSACLHCRAVPRVRGTHLWASIERRCEAAALVRARERRSSYFWLGVGVGVGLGLGVGVGLGLGLGLARA